MRSGLLLGLLLLTSPSPLLCARAESAFRGPIYYVSVLGDDRNGNGSSKRPWATISAAVRHISQDGGLLLVRDGLYTGNVRISKKFSHWLIIQAEHPYRALLRNAQGQTLAIWDSANVIVSGFDIARSTPFTRAPLAAQIARAENIALLDNLIHDSFNNDVLKINESCRNLLIQGNVFYNQQGSAGQLIDVNGGRDVFIQENIFFNDSGHSALRDLSDTHGFLVAKNSGDAMESRRISIARNIWLNFEGGAGSNFILLGEDGKPFYEVQEVNIENNLMLGNSPVLMRAPLGIKGAQRVLYHFNTVVGNLPARAFAVRMNREGRNPVNRQITFVNNIWSSPAGTMARFADGGGGDAEALLLRNNVYWNGGRSIPGGLLDPAADPRKLFANPLIASNGVLLPFWQGEHFLSGALRIREEFVRLVRSYGSPAHNSPVVGRADPVDSPGVDILGAPRGKKPDIGSVQVGSVVLPLRIFLLPQRVSAGESTLNQVVLETPAPASGTVVQLHSSSRDLAAVPARVVVLPGRTTALFPIRVARTSQPSTVTIDAHTPQTGASALLDVVPPAIHSILLSAPEVWAGESKHKVFLESTAPEDVTDIRLSSSRPDLISFPVPPVVKKNSSAVELVLLSRPVPKDTPVAITAAYAGSSRTAILTVRPGMTLLSLALSRSHAYNASTVTGTVTISEPAPPGGLRIPLFSKNPEIAQVPPEVVVPESARSTTFTVQTQRIRTRTVATVFGRYREVHAAYLVVDYAQLRSVALPADPRAAHGGLIYLTIPAPPGGLSCALSSSKPELLAVQSQVALPEGASRIPFSYALRSSQQGSITVSALCDGITKSTAIEIRSGPRP